MQRRTVASLIAGLAGSPWLIGTAQAGSALAPPGIQAACGCAAGAPAAPTTCSTACSTP